MGSIILIQRGESERGMTGRGRGEEGGSDDGLVMHSLDI